MKGHATLLSLLDLGSISRTKNPNSKLVCHIKCLRILLRKHACLPTSWMPQIESHTRARFTRAHHLRRDFDPSSYPSTISSNMEFPLLKLLLELRHIAFQRLLDTQHVPKANSTTFLLRHSRQPVAKRRN
ncbi:hypothetical protein BDZ45DRAFT_795871 [Acephala macrosclerotiorum]|nr:hypothetical protein BDZ45DRAFT_795871 [Acephala macrosclerotiorum]